MNALKRFDLDCARVSGTVCKDYDSKMTRVHRPVCISNFIRSTLKHVRVVKLKLKVWIVEGKLSIRYFSKRNSLILTINTWPDVPKSSIRFPEWNIFLCSEPSRQNNGKKHLHPSPSADLVVSLSQLSQMLIPIFYLLLENRTKKSQKFALQIRFFRLVSNMIIFILLYN